MSRWTARESAALAAVRSELSVELRSCAPFPEVVGDRRLIRFIRGHNFHVEKVCAMIRRFLEWRVANNVDEVRTDIVQRGMNSPYKFPSGKKILKLIPQLVISTNVMDRTGAPVSVETYDFRPREVLDQISLEEYTRFWVYCLEFKMIVLEQLSEQREREFLAENPHPIQDGWGVVVPLCVVRDLKGLGLDHLGSQGLEIIRAVLDIAQPNYPELMHRCVIINAPWVFNMAWKLIKQLLAQHTIDKIILVGTVFQNVLHQHIAPEKVPSIIGGPVNVDIQEFAFDTSVGGLLWYEHQAINFEAVPDGNSEGLPRTPEANDAHEEIEVQYVPQEDESTLNGIRKDYNGETLPNSATVEADAQTLVLDYDSAIHTMKLAMSSTDPEEIQKAAVESIHEAEGCAVFSPRPDGAPDSGWVSEIVAGVSNYGLTETGCSHEQLVAYDVGSDDRALSVLSG